MLLAFANNDFIVNIHHEHDATTSEHRKEKSKSNFCVRDTFHSGWKFKFKCSFSVQEHDIVDFAQPDTLSLSPLYDPNDPAGNQIMMLKAQIRCRLAASVLKYLNLSNSHRHRFLDLGGVCTDRKKKILGRASQRQHGDEIKFTEMLAAAMFTTVMMMMHSTRLNSWNLAALRLFLDFHYLIWEFFFAPSCTFILPPDDVVSCYDEIMARTCR